MHKAQTLNESVCLDAQNYEQTSLRASPFVTPRFCPKRLSPREQGSAHLEIQQSISEKPDKLDYCTDSKEKNLPVSPCSNESDFPESGSAESRETPYLRDRNQEGSNADHGEMRFANTTIKEIQTSCTSEPHCKLRYLLQR